MLQQQLRPQRRLGDALFGDVWLCEDLQAANSLAAVKVVSLEAARRVLREHPGLDNPWRERETLKLLARLGAHPHVLRARREFVLDGAWCVVMDFCADGDLWTLLQAAPGNRLPEREALRLFAQVASGLRFLHAHGVAHRDVSLENVFLSDGVCKLADFGLSTDTDRVCSDRVGKAYYMAPEVVAQQPYDPAAADMWSLGVLLFILLTGAPLTPLASPKDKAFLALRRYGVREILAAWNMQELVSDASAAVLERLLRVDPAERPTADELHAMLS